jgi:cobalt-zinc-cadmium efflux system protein
MKHEHHEHEDDHHHDHDHDHDHGHHHHHAHALPAIVSRPFIFGIILNSVFVIAEVVTGIYTHSLSLLSDAGHNLGDVASLALALLAARYAQRKASATLTFGYKQSTVLVALLNAVILLLALGAIAWEAILRLSDPHEIQAGPVAIVATGGIIINTISALLFMKNKDKDLNVRGAYLHMASDALVSLGVVISGLIILYTHWYWLDAVVSLLIVAVIVYGTWGLLRESLRLSLNGVPDSVDLGKIKKLLLSQKGITGIHDLHVWALSTTENALTVHLIAPEGIPGNQFYHDLNEELLHHYNIAHTTIQVESSDAAFACEQACLKE